MASLRRPAELTGLFGEVGLDDGVERSFRDLAVWGGEAAVTAEHAGGKEKESERKGKGQAEERVVAHVGRP